MPTVTVAAPRSVSDSPAAVPAVCSQSTKDINSTYAVEPDVTWLEAERPECEVDCVHWLVS